ncbi:GNAT family N-acetyltransferase [Pontibacter amylolyticus]|uniref:BioF2-like acetyltransferase domain-containing protein n=1 Tax=Pontibacter amylolyticus TaxID=1424080 RepID=A0ABQ1W325_9BACT|nr:GNAT family N-acetyltransferase [Pontibacter amylolyticus]GGG12516.1 hypothetical protein GCM10011323_16190 [Pontibacter amylolyticus]
MIIPEYTQEKSKLDCLQSNEIGSIDLLVGNDVMLLLANVNFIAEWNQLYSVCPWATIFQTYDFVASWYKHYSDRHTPIVVLSRYRGRLTGLLPLAQGVNELGIAGAGGHDAYYHLWLSTPLHGEIFIQAALKTLLNRFPNQDITLKYIPQNVPMGWIEKSDYWKKNSVIRNFRRPLLNLINLDRGQVLSKRSFKERYNRLKKLGEVKFELIKDPDVLDVVMDQLADQFDIRKAATLNIMPFKDDPAKKKFLLDLIKKNVLIAAVLKLNGNIISGITATTSRAGWSHGAGINTYSPAYGRYSPAYVILKLLSIALKDAGVTMFDITPGGHTYKEAHADEYDTLIELRLTSKYKALYLKNFYKIKALVKSVIEKNGLDARQLRNTMSTKYIMKKESLLLFLNISSLSKSAIPHAAKVTQIVLDEHLLPTNLGVKQDCLKDILLFNPNGSDITRWEFMKKVMKHYEAGFISYTYCENNQLLCLVWLAPQHLRSREINDEVEIKSLPSDSAILCNIYCHSKVTEKLAPFIKKVADKILTSSPNKTIYLLENLDIHPK